MVTSKCDKDSKRQYAGFESFGLLRRMVLCSWFVLPMLASSASWGQQPQRSTVLNKNGRVELQVLDSATGYRVSSATIKWDTVGESAPSALSHSGISSANGQFAQELSPNEYAFEISAPGYQPMRTHFGITLGSVVRANIHLDPIDPPAELRESVIASELRDGYELVHGYIVDGETHLPLAGVKLRLQENDTSSLSDSRGYFQLYAEATSTENASKPEDFPARDTLTATLSGYKTYTLTGILHVPGSHTVLRIALAPGTGATNERIDHRPLLPAGAIPETVPPAENPISNALKNWLGISRQAIVQDGQTSVQGAAFATAAITLPPSIRVGSNCTQTHGYGCATTDTYSLEMYVQNGLDKEWIPSWKTDSLMAGAVAYRSYGAWYVANPICPSTSSSCPTTYDICNNTWCQVYNSKSQPATVAAAKSTAGIVLSSDGVNIFYAEHASNTNGLNCPDGQTGQPSSQPALNWPCMLDPIATGSPGLGHGRGMSQWGSQYWARGLSYQGVATTPRDWRCILDHYYNDNSNSTGAEAGNRIAYTQGADPYGKIAYSTTNIYTMNADGSSAKRLTNETLDQMPSWSSDGKRIAFIGPSNGLFYINADGSGETLITSAVSPGLAMFRPNWSRSGNDQILFYTQPAPYYPEEIYTVNSDGSSRIQLTSGTLGSQNNQNGDMSAYGSKIVYSCGYICVMNSDGSGVQQLTNIFGDEPKWSPDGSKIVFSTNALGDSAWDIVIMNADGSNRTQLTTPAFAGEFDINPTWLNNQQIVFTSSRDYPGRPCCGPYEIYSMNADGSSQTRLTHSSFTSQPYPDCSRCARFDKL